MKKHLFSSFLFFASLLLTFQLVSPLEKASALTINNNYSEKSYNYVVSTLVSDGESHQINKSEQIIQKSLLLMIKIGSVLIVAITILVVLALCKISKRSDRNAQIILASSGMLRS